MSSLGYHNAPVSKLYVVTVAGVNVLATIAGIPKGPSTLGYLTPKATFLDPLQWWRFLFGPFVFSTLGEIFFGLFLLHSLRLFERRWGSTKFAVFVILTNIVTFLLQSVFWAYPDNYIIWNGPYGFMYAALVQYVFDVPSTLSLKVWKVPLSEKFFIYLLGFQLLISNVPGSLVAGIFGIFCGLFYRLRFMKRIHRLVPKFIIRLCGKYLYPLLNPRPFRIRQRRSTSSTSTRNIPFQSNQPEQQNNQDEDGANNQTAPQRVRNLAQDDDIDARFNRFNFFNQELLRMMQRGRPSQQPGNSGEPQARQPPAPQQQQQYQPSDDDVQQLVDMGFDRTQARAALMQSGGDVNMAVARLIG